MITLAEKWMTTTLRILRKRLVQGSYVRVCARALSCSVISDWAPWTAIHQAPLSMEFSRQAYWSGLPFPTLGDLPDPGIELASLVVPALAGKFFTTGATWEALKGVWDILYLRCLSYNCIYSLTFFKPLFKSPFSIKFNWSSNLILQLAPWPIPDPSYPNLFL